MPAHFDSTRQASLAFGRSFPTVLAAALVALGGCGRGAPPADPDTIAAPATHAEIAVRLTALIEHEMHDKAIPAVSIALVDGNQTVWARGFGAADAPAGAAATANTVYRIGSVSKLFTDLGVMQLVEQGKLDPATTGAAPST